MEEDERVELIGGACTDVAQRDWHEVLKCAFVDHWIRRRPDDCRLAQETTFRLSDDTYLEPDVVIYPRESGLEGLTE